VFSSLVFVLALSTTPVPALSPALEQEARALEAALVAPCCWSQQVSVHQSPAADEIRQDVRRRLARGQTRQQVLDHYVGMFGERILVEPPARGTGLMLYVFPPIAMILSAAGIVALVKRATAGRSRATPADAGAADGARPAGDYQARLEDELRDMD
jgi:cytochrome c-type biogenesis protein CcmH